MSGKSIGKLDVVQRASQDSMILDINSAISTRMIIMFRITSVDKTIFEKGRLRYSYTSRQVNKGKRSTTETRVLGAVYHSEKGGKTIQVSESPIFHNMSSLYLQEPVDIKYVYSDVFQEFVKIIPVSVHNYKIKLPDGNYNEYFYSNGICKRIKVHSTLFTAQMDLRSIRDL
jgi:hypothetical protein